MPDTVRAKEQKQSRRIRASIDASTEMDYVWRVAKTYDPDEVVAALTAARPASVVDPIWGRTLVPKSTTIDPIGSGVWDAVITYVDTVKYDEIRQIDTGESRFAFSTTGGTLHIVTSLEVMASYTLAGYTATPYSALIGVTDDGVEGVDIVIPAMSFSIDFRHPKATITHAFRKLLGDMTGTTNDGVFMGHAAGEVLFMGADGAQGNKSDPQLTYQFLQSTNRTALVVGGIAGIAKSGIAGIAKKGHEYLSVYYETFPDPGSNRKTKRPIQVDVHRLYESSDFSQLGIGTS